MQHQREALGSLYELKFTLNVADAIAEQITTLGDQVSLALAMQSDEIRCLDITQDDLGACLGDLISLSSFGEATLQPQIDEAAEALHELPQVRAELERVCMDRVDTLSELRLVRDAAEEERRSHMSAVQTISSQAAKDAEEAKFKIQMQANQLQQLSAVTLTVTLTAGEPAATALSRYTDCYTDCRRTSCSSCRPLH